MENDNQELDKDTSVLERLNEASTPIWAGILAIYLLLFTATGYVAFFSKEFNPALDLKPEYVASLEDQDTKSFVIDTLKQEAATYQKKRELASQSFNVVMGALLGFLSASAASVFRRRRNT